MIPECKTMVVDYQSVQQRKFPPHNILEKETKKKERPKKKNHLKDIMAKRTRCNVTFKFTARQNDFCFEPLSSNKA